MRLCVLCVWFWGAADLGRQKIITLTWTHTTTHKRTNHDDRMPLCRADLRLALSDDEARRVAAEAIIHDMGALNQRLFDEANLVSREMMDVAITWHEYW